VERIVSMVKRRPCTEAEMASSLGADAKDVSEAVQRLASEGRVSRVRFDDRDFVEARG
jgi:predicted transcriptional regulator